MMLNVNDNVWVRLTTLGRRHLAHTQSVEWLKHNLHEQRGWTRFQLWELMQVFGARMGCGFDLVFETNMAIGDAPPRDTAPPESPERAAELAQDDADTLAAREVETHG